MSQLWISILLLLTISQTYASILDVEVKVSSSLVAISRNVTFTCIVTKSDSSYQSRVELGKYLLDSTGTSMVQPITTGGGQNLEQRFENTGRYFLSMDSNGDEDIYTLTIDRLTEQDNANFGCREEDGEWATVNFNVRMTPTNVAFEDHGFEETVSFVQGEPQPLTCIAIGGSPAPDMDVVGVSDDHSYFDDFDRTVTHEIQCEESEWDSSNCLMYRRYTTTFHASEFEPLPEHHQQSVECVAHIPGLEEASIKSRITVDLTFKPAFFCDVDHFEAEVGDSVILTCEFDANPDVDENDCYWEVEVGGETQQLKDGEFTADNEIESVINFSKKTMSLKFATVTEEHHDTETFYMVLSNSIGQSTKPIYLTDVGASHPGAGSTFTASLLMILYAMIAGYFLH